MNREFNGMILEKAIFGTRLRNIIVIALALLLTLVVYPMALGVMRSGGRTWNHPLPDLLAGAVNYLIILTTVRFFSRRLQAKTGWIDQPVQRFFVLLLISIAVPVFSTVLIYLPYLTVYHRLAFLPPGFIFQTAVATLMSLVFSAALNSYYFLEEWKTARLKTLMLEKENVQAQFDVLKSQLSPHFLFNNLNILRILATRNSASMVEYIDHFSEVFRHILESDYERPVTLRKEIEFLRSYIYLLETRHQQSLQFHLDVPEESLDAGILANTLQLLVENSIKHNAFSSSHPLELSIRAESGYLTVQNRKRAKLHVESTGLGLKNISTRYRLVAARDVQIENAADFFTVKIPLLAATAEDINS